VFLNSHYLAAIISTPRAATQSRAGCGLEGLAEYRSSTGCDARSLGRTQGESVARTRRSRIDER
jgi:hypothetical protein